ncbi:MAG: TetM/TetW/TetO/TetS family tetracycline resistance ribosomal protection protein [Actinomycetota bacterium]|nr:TetM/TetW/TetO/TetS family tetracycline resistance ribosomal protection protein [Actinomycetota bacterium]
MAHVDAGKTTLTERLLYAAGVIDEIGSVDAGTTQTDSLALEQQRGITIKSAVVSFAIDDVTVNLIDTPGHPDFIAEVERVLSVLDGAVLVVSAVEGVQPQTRVLMRALQRLRIPTLMFVNKIDRPGADCERVLSEIRRRLTPAAIAMGSVTGEGSRSAVYTAHAQDDAAFTSRLVDLLAEHDDALLSAYVDDESSVSSRQLGDEFAAQTKQVLVHPVFCGSAITGAGVDALAGGIVELLPAAASDGDGPVSAAVFKVERGVGGEKIAYTRLFSGTIRVRDRVDFRRDGLEEDEAAKVTAISVFDGAAPVRSVSVAAGEIGKLWGLAEIQIGDTIGEPTPRTPARDSFAPPTLESVAVPRRAADKGALFVALEQLAEQDPLIDVRRDDRRRQISVSLYGEVQKEVIQATLANDYGIDVDFRETTPIHVERPIATGEAVEILHAESNPFLATVGLRVGRGSNGSGIDFRLEVDSRTVPLYAYKKLENFADSMGEYVHQTLREGLFGWQVTDCIVTMTECNYSSPDGPPATRGPLSTAADFRKLTPVVLMRALERAGTVVCEPMARLRLEIPTASLGAVLPAVARLGAAIEAPSLHGDLSVVEAVLPSARVRDLERQLPGLTGGEGVLESSFAGYQPVSGNQPTRPRTTPNPLNFDEYLMHLARRVGS